MKVICFFVLFFLAQPVLSQEDTLKGPDIVDRLFNTADKVVDMFSGKSWIFVPALTYAPETSLGFGIGALKYFRTREDGNLRPSTMPISLLYTLNRQVMFSTELDLWWNGNKDHLFAELELQDYPFRFYGIGNEIALPAGERYSSRMAQLKVNFQKRIAPGIFLGPQYVFRLDEVFDKVVGGLLDTGTVPGSNGQRSSGLGILLQYDTRDNIFQPGKGSYHQLSYLGFSRFFGSDYEFGQYRLDLRKYLNIFRSHVVAGQLWYSYTGGHAPFQQLAMMGGSDIMRGYFEGKYRDHMAMVYQMEYRLPVYRTLGLVFFGSTGTVAEKFSSLPSGRLRYGGGMGFRYRLMDDGLNFRLDIAFGDQTSFYFGLDEVF